MALDGNRLGDAIVALLNVTGLNASEQTQLQTFWRDAGNAIVDEITNNGIITTTSGAPDGEHTGEIA